MATTASAATRSIPTSPVGKDFDLVRSPDAYNPIPPRADAIPKSAVHISPRSRNDLVERHRQQPNRSCRALKSPLYVPAVLRPTEKPLKQSPPKEVDTNPDAGYEGWRSIANENVTMTGSSSVTRIGISRVPSDELNEVEIGPVTGLPSTNHWKPDSAAAICNARNCEAVFGFFTRRHHCRRCGSIFCWQHSSQQAPLNQHALFHPKGLPSRVCDRCFDCYREWEMQRTSRSNSQSSSASFNSGLSGASAALVSPRHDSAHGSDGSPYTPVVPAIALGEEASEQDVERPRLEQPQEEFGPKSFVTSIPNHWNWSTF